MITTGIIREINLSEGNYSNNKYKVEIGLFQTASSTNPDSYTIISNACQPGGMYSSYSVGDKVYVAFLEDKLNQPIILGHIYQGLDLDKIRSFGNFDALNVSGNVSLPADTTIGDITYQQLYSLFLKQSKDTGLSDLTYVEIN